MRSLPEIDLDIAAAEQRLSELQAEREGVRQTQVDAALRSFDAGRSCKEIARDLRMNKNTVAGILWRAGRTEKQRAAKRQRVVEHLEAAPT